MCSGEYQFCRILTLCWGRRDKTFHGPIIQRNTGIHKYSETLPDTFTTLVYVLNLQEGELACRISYIYLTRVLFSEPSWETSVPRACLDNLECEPCFGGGMVIEQTITEELSLGEFGIWIALTVLLSVHLLPFLPSLIYSLSGIRKSSANI